MHRTDDLRIRALRPLLSPAILQEEIPLTEGAARTITDARKAIAGVIDGRDDRLLVVVGPCSVHDPDAAREYAARLSREAQRHRHDLLITMRTYFEKPRTTVGWKGLINDPHLDGSYDINRGLRLARGLLADIVAMGLPTSVEFLDPISPQFVADLVAWGAIGARTAESQVHRELASGLSMPIGFKNGTGGDVDVAAHAVRAAAHPHHFLGVTKQGLCAIVSTSGNRDCHVILRGGRHGSNYDAASVADAVGQLSDQGLAPRLMVDCSHGNSNKDHTRQPAVAANVAHQVATGSTHVMGVMLESFLLPGRHEGADQAPRGVSITDACMGWDTTTAVLDTFAAAARARRAVA